MGRNFNGTTDNLSYAGAIVTAEPFTISAWMSADDAAALKTVLGVGHTSNANFFAQEAGTTGDGRPASCRRSDGASANSTAGFTIGSWENVIAVFAATNDRRAYVRGSNKGTQGSDAGAMGAVNRTNIGALTYQGTLANYFKGKIAEVAIWNIALTDDNATALGVSNNSPLLVARPNLIAYWRINGSASPEVDEIGGFNMTVNGTTSTDHPSIVYPSTSTLAGTQPRFAYRGSNPRRGQR